MNREDILRKCQGLLALSKNGDEATMLSAAAKLQAWMAKYQLSLDDIAKEEKPTDGIQDLKVAGKYNESWRRTCYEAAAKLFMCNYYFVAIGTKDVGVYHHVIGQPHNVAVAKEMAIYFEATINRLANEASRGSGIDRGEHTTRHQFIRSFRLTASNRLYQRVLQYVNDAKQGLLLDPETGSQLPAMLSIYESAEAVYEIWLEEMGFKIKEVKSRDQILHQRAATLGRQAGDKISFTTQIGTASAAHALPSR